MLAESSSLARPDNESQRGPRGVLSFIGSRISVQDTRVMLLLACLASLVTFLLPWHAGTLARW